MLWIVPGFFAVFGGLFVLAPGTWVTLALQARRREGYVPMSGQQAKGVVQVRGFGIALLVTAAVFAGLILGGVLD